LPNTGKYSLVFEVVHSSMNCIEFGIMPNNFIPI